MRGLWVEDFGNKLNKEEIESLKAKWIEQLGLHDVKLENTKTLASSLMHINKNNNSIDFVILDINFPVFDANANEDEDAKKFNSNESVYEEFFLGHILKEYYEDKVDSGAGTGVLVYRYLTEVVHFPKDKIAFFSANIIKSNNDYPDEIQKILKYNHLGNAIEDLEYYIEEEKPNISLDVNSLQNIEDLRKWIRNNISPILKNSNVDLHSNRIYTEAEKALEAVGTKIEHAYIKDEICCKFYTNFYENNNTNYVKLRCCIQEMSKIISKYLVNQKVDIDILSENVHNLDKMCKNMYDKAYYSNVVNSILKMPLNEKGFSNSENKNNKNIIKILKNELINLIHSLEGFKRNSINDYNRFEHLKLTRNWLSHSIFSDKSFNIYGFAYTFLLAYQFYFDINKLSIKDKIDYEYYEKKLIELTKKLQPEAVLVGKNLSQLYKKENFNSKEDICKYYKNIGIRRKSSSFDKLSYNQLIDFYNLLNYYDEIHCNS